MIKHEKPLFFLVKIGIAGLLLLNLALVFFLTLAFDEAWLFTKYAEIFDQQKHTWKLAHMSFTNGGPFTYLGTLIYSLFGANTVAFRLMSVGSLLGILGICWSWSRRWYKDRETGLLLLAVVLGVWGTIKLGSTAFGAVPGMLLLLLGVYFWGELQQNWKRWLLCGALFGCAAATRLNLIAIFPALLIAVAFQPDRRKDAVVICFFGALIYGLNLLLMMGISPISTAEFVHFTVDFTEMNSLWIDYPRFLNKWVVVNGFLPMYLMVGATAYAFWSERPSKNVMQLLVVFGWVHWVAWMLKAPIPHQRYFWPTILSFTIVLGDALASLFEWGKAQERKEVCYAVIGCVVGVLVMGGGDAFRSLVHGETNLLSWEGSREVPISYFHAFDHLHEQKQMAEYLREHVAEDEEIAVMGYNMELEFLSGRKIVPLEYYRNNPEAQLPKRVLSTPMIGTFYRLQPECIVWCKKNLKPEVRYGGYVLYRVEGSYPADFSILEKLR